MKRRIAALIPARGGSKGVIKKNIKLLAGKPLIQWTIESLKKSTNDIDIYVSTDCEEISKISKECGAIVPFLRPSSLSDDHASTESVVEHFIEWSKKNSYDYSDIILAQCTSPIRKPKRFDRAIKQYFDENADSLLTVTNAGSFVWKNIDKPECTYGINNRKIRQKIPIENNYYLETGSFYITSVNNYLINKNRLGGKVTMHLTEEYEGLEIDNEMQFEMCEIMLRNKNFLNLLEL